MKRRQGEEGEDWLTQATKKRLEAAYRPPVTPWLAKVGWYLRWISLDFARAHVAAVGPGAAPDDAMTNTMRDLLSYHARSPYVNMLYEVAPYPSAAVIPVVVVAKRCAYEFAVLAGGTFAVGVDDFGGHEDIPFGCDYDVAHRIRDVTELVADASESSWVHEVLPTAVGDWIAADDERARRYAAFATAWRADLPAEEKRRLAERHDG